MLCSITTELVDSWVDRLKSSLSRYHTSVSSTSFYVHCFSSTLNFDLSESPRPKIGGHPLTHEPPFKPRGHLKSGRITLILETSFAITNTYTNVAQPYPLIGTEFPATSAGFFFILVPPGFGSCSSDWRGPEGRIGKPLEPNRDKRHPDPILILPMYFRLISMVCPVPIMWPRTVISLGYAGVRVYYEDLSKA